MNICTVRVYHSEDSPLSAVIREEIAVATFKLANYETVVLKLGHTSQEILRILDFLAAWSEDRQRLDEVERTYGSFDGKVTAALRPSERYFDSDGFYCPTYHLRGHLSNTSRT